jgi:undecaprenyl-diphosphatase
MIYIVLGRKIAKFIITRLPFKTMDTSASKNLKNIIDIFFKQLTELGSLTIISAMIIFTFFLDTSLALKLLVGIAAATIISMIIKALFFRARPKKQSINTIIDRIDASSFPSVHSARITILVFLLAAYIADIWLTIFLMILGALVAYSRIYMKRHYYSDVIGGIVLGMIISVIIYII